MLCTRPSYCLDLGTKENGKRLIKFLPKRVDLYSAKQLQYRYGADSVIAVPCCSCLACRINYAKEWAVRCVLESLYHEENYFITLTYDNEHLPDNGLINREHMREFQLKVWSKFPGVRFFGCGEYGSKNGRCHWHLIAFGLPLNDFKAVGNGLYESATLKKLWPYGFNYVGEVNYATCNYVAQYCTKKVFSDSKNILDKKNREYIFCSTKPGIGFQWCNDHINTLLEYDKVFGPFGSKKAVAVPRYFQRVAEKLDSEAFKDFKKSRLDNSKALQISECITHQVSEVEILFEFNEKKLVNDFCNQKKGSRL